MADTAMHDQRRLKPMVELAEEREHGDRLKYLAGCRCSLCRKANSSYESGRRQARRAGKWNGTVCAKRARKHIESLREQGVSLHAIQAVTDIGGSIIWAVSNGNKQSIRAETERLILAVTAGMASDGAKVDAAPTWELINALLRAGISRRTIAREIGSKAKNPQLRIDKHRVTVRTAEDVRKVYQRLYSAAQDGAV